MTINGPTVAVDPRGDVRASLDAFESPGGTMTASVPTAHVRTVYTRVGDLFGWLCLAATLALLVMTRR